MNKLKVNGILSVKGMNFHDIEGGFGEGKKAMLVKEIANIHARELREVNQSINMNRKRFINDVDIVDIKGTEFAINLIDSEIYTQNSINASSNIYLLSERGYAKLLKIMDDDLAWQKYDELVDGYFNMRANKPQCIEDVLISSLQEMKAIRNEVQAVKKATEETKESIQGIRDVVSLTPNAWRKDTSILISKIAMQLGGFEHIKDVREESYNLLNQTFKVNVERRLNNKRKNMALEGVSKSKIKNFNVLDVISEDTKLINGYISIVSKMAIKYGAV